ncbi:MFS transporter [Gracilibacillus caseinilyticus]|uniref:MFS transporter n=1 Tax=Gracilibacillus caseinilyticus TaxID=2932256 RepID=A0ABY4ETC1_9BACI|nr:MFS transporter [Gracilibacillus caseinilyticus]UOQ46874.1 MFS transporter [Gracilibacillus caseinilyticus]
MTTASIWKNKMFLRLFSSYSVSMLGRWFDMVAILILFSYVWEANPFIIALIPVAYALPHAFLSQFSGVLADRFNKVKLMLTADIATAILTLILFFAPNPAIALPVLLLRATVTVIHFPAQQALIKSVVEEKLIVKAVTLNGSVDQLTKIIGPFLGGGLASAFSPKLCILFNAIAYGVSALILVSILKKDLSSIHSNLAQKLSFWQSWREGWSTVLNSRILIVSIIFSLLAFIAIQMVDAQIAVLFREIAPSRPELIGWLMASAGAGAFVMLVMMNRLDKVHSYGFIFGGSVLFIGAGFGGVGFLYVGVPNYIPASCGFIAGLGVGLFSVGSNYVIQKESTSTNIGCVSGIFSSLTSLMVLVAPLAGGMLVSLINVETVFQAVGISLAVIGIIGIMFRKVLWRETVQTDSTSRVTKSV